MIGRLALFALLVSAPADPGPAALAVSVRARAIRPGELVVLTIAAPEAATAVRVSAFGRSIDAWRVDARTWEALVGVDLDQAPGSYQAAVEAATPDGPARGGSALRVQPRHFPTRRLSVDDAFVNPPAAVTARIEEEARALRAIYAAPTSAPLWHDPFVRPVPGPANSRFGTRSVFNGVPRNPHAGGDFLSPAGTPVLAPNAGHVVLARDLYFTGNTVVLDHGGGVLSMLAHLSKIDVTEGADVGRGQEVGLVGATGRVTGPHLHWAVRVNNARVDPLSLLAVLGAEER